ncbi:MAG: Ig-like domain-containing protein [Paludibacteraceae bacterium]|nr:Ig-like domain-containing protein [Paludibacteraceae bacterium]
MKKLFLSALALLASVCLYATDLNIYASGLNATQPNGTESVTIQYVLNAPATAVSVKLYHGNDAPIVIPITDNTKWAKGQNTVEIDLSAVPANTYTWAIEASAASRATSQSVSITQVAINNTQSRGMTIDDNPESPYFGTIYIANKESTGKIVSVSPDFASVNDIVTGKWTSGQNSSPMRLAIGEDGLLYVGDASDKNPNITIIDRAATNTTSLVFGGTAESTGLTKNGNISIHGSIPGLCVLGEGANRVLYTVDEDLLTGSKKAIYAYNIGELESVWTQAPSRVVFSNPDGKISNWNQNLFADGHGGFWISQNRWTDTPDLPCLGHVNSNGVMDWFSTGEITPSAAYSSSFAALFVNHDKSLIVTNTRGASQIWEPVFGEGYSVSGLTHKATIATGVSTDNYNVIMDPAQNVYVLGDNCLVGVATASENVYETPARTVNTIVSTGNVKQVTGVSLESTASVELGKTMTLVPTFTPADATDKSASWASNNESVATVSDGVVSAVAVGEAVITMTTTDGGYQATCTVTVYRNPVTGITIEPNTLTLASGFRATLDATVLPDNATDKSVVWTSDDEGIATVADGVVTAVAEGTTTIKATSVSDGEVFGSCTVTVSPAVAHISAWGLSSEKTETGYTFSFTTNMAATNAAIVFYDKASGNPVGDPVSVTVTEGDNEVAIQAAEIPGNVGQELTWAVRLTGEDNAAFSKVFESANITGRAHLVVDASPESNYMGRTYYICRTAASSTTLYVFDQNYVQLASKPTYSHGFMHQSIDENGKLWIPDWRDASSGIYIVDPADLNTCTQFFQGTRTASGTYGGIIKNGTVEVGGSSPSCFIYGKGEDRKLFSIQEDFSSVRNQPMAIYNVGKSYERSTAPDAIYPVTGNDGFTNSIFAVDKGYWVSKNCPKSSHSKTIPALEFYSMSGKLKYSSYDHRDIIDGCLGTGFTIDPVHNKLYMIDGGSANILEFDVAYDGDSVPTLTPAGKHYIGYKGATSMSMDIAGNLYVTATMSTTIDNTISMKMVVYSPATNGNNTTEVPAKAADVIKPFATLYEFGSNQSWATNAGVAMKEVEENVFEKIITFEETDNYFTFSRAQGATDNDWTSVNAHRYGTNADGDYWVTNENINNTITLEAEGTRTNSFKIPAGTYLFHVDLNTMKFNVYAQRNLQVFEVGDNQGSWDPANKIAFEEVEGTINVFKGTISFANSLSYFALTTSTATTWDINNSRYGGADNDELVDGVAGTMVQGSDKCFTIKPGTYEITVNFNTNKVTAKLIGDAVKVSEVGYATYYNSAHAYVMPENMVGYPFVAGIDLDEANKYDAGETVPAGIGLVLEAAAGTYGLLFTTGGNAPAYNDLLGTDVATNLAEADADAADYYYYALSLNAAGKLNSVGFYWMNETGAAFTNGAHKAYLRLPKGNAAPQRFYLFYGENNTTDILNVKSADEAVKFIENGKLFIRRDGVIYDATGRRVR